MGEAAEQGNASFVGDVIEQWHKSQLSESDLLGRKVFSCNSKILLCQCKVTSRHSSPDTVMSHLSQNAVSH